MNTKYNNNSRPFFGLNNRQKVIFLAVLWGLSAIFGYAACKLCYRVAEEFKTLNIERNVYKSWKEKAKQSEQDLSKIPILQYGENYKKIDLSTLESEIEKITIETEADYVLSKLEIKKVKDYKINQLKINFYDISLSNLITFAEKIDKLGDNIAISETQIQAKNNMLLNVEVVISILEI